MASKYTSNYSRFQFYDLPFTPNYDEVIYVEAEYDERTNQQIKENYDFIKEAFAKRGKRFVYLPYLTQELLSSDEVWRYRNPVMTISMNELPVLESNFMMKYCRFSDRIKITKPAFFIATPYLDLWFNNAPPLFYDGLAIDVGEMDDAEAYWDYMVEQIAEFSPTWVEYRRIINSKNGNGILLREITDPDYLFEDEVNKMLEEVRLKVDQLRRSGISDVILSKIIFPKTPLSTLRITKDYRIFLSEYNDLEIHMTPIVKAVYFLFLRHPEGILFKELIDYREELDMIYRSVKEKKKMKEQPCAFFEYEQVQRICDPTDNSINEKCARIKEAFLLKIHEDIAQEYIVTGKRGGPKRVNLSVDKIIWE